jgi:hypothetical protein
MADLPCYANVENVKTTAQYFNFHKGYSIDSTASMCMEELFVIFTRYGLIRHCIPLQYNLFIHSTQEKGTFLAFILYLQLTFQHR